MSERSSVTAIPWGSLAVVAAFVSSTLLLPQAFSPLRPAEKERAQPLQSAELEVEARLWEDPFAATRRFEADRMARCDKAAGSLKLRGPAGEAGAKAASAASGADCDDLALQRRRAPEHLIAALDRDGNHDLTDTLVVAVMLPGNAFVGAEESRRRTRYAILAGLQAQGLAPDDSEHFGLLNFNLPSNQVLLPSDAKAVGASPDETARALRVPYELLSRRQPLRGDTAAERAPADAAGVAANAAHTANAPNTGSAPYTPPYIPPYTQVALLWVDEAALPKPGLDSLAAMLGKLLRTPSAKDWNPRLSVRGTVRPNLPALALIGPSDSDGLRTALGDLDRSANQCLPVPTYVPPGTDLAPPETDDFHRDTGRCPGMRSLVIRGYQLLAKARVFNATATASDGTMPALHQQSLEPFLHERLARIAGMPLAQPLDYARIMATDDKVLTSMVTELKRRLPPDEKRRVVLLVERDSVYARALQSELAYRLGDKRSAQYSDKLQLETHYFYRGLDGATTFDSVQAQATTTDKASGKDKAPASPLEWPESRDQLDYLRRLSIALKASEADLDPPPGQNGGAIGAIGLLASDVHDKLLALQALHDSFSDKVFFTTDMDARYLHPRTVPYTRNLVVASSLPLAFADSAVQAGTPPLRDVYQMANFLAAQRAACGDGAGCKTLKDEAQNAVNAPSVYEIGRSHAVPLDGYDHAVRVRHQHLSRVGVALPLWLALALGLLVWPCTPALLSVRGWLFGMPPAAGDDQAVPRATTAMVAVLHLAVLAFALGSAVEFATPGRLGLGGIWVLTAGVIGAASLWLLVRFASLPTPVVAKPCAFWLPGAVGAGLMAAALLGIAWPAASALACVDCEPAAWLEGVSAWPSHLIHLLALVALVCILDLQWTRVRDRFARDADWLAISPEASPEVPPQVPPPVPPPVPPRSARRCWCDISLFGWHSASLAADQGSVDVKTLWAETTLRARPMARLVRTVLGYCFTLGLMVGLFLALSNGQVPEVPVRGLDHRSLVRLTLYTVLLALPLLMVAVGDATLLNQRLIHFLDQGRSRYPNSSLARFAAALGAPVQAGLWRQRFVATPSDRSNAGAPADHTLLDNWIDVHLVARRTSAVAPLVLGPMAIVAMLVVARSRLFDNWAITTPVLLGICAYLAWLVVLGVMLKLAAEHARSKALHRMLADLLWLGGAGAAWAPLIEPFKRLIDEVRDIQEGAFAPLLEQPLFKSLLVPLGGLGGTQLFDSLLLAR